MKNTARIFAGAAAAITMMVAGVIPFRGLSLWSLWLLESTERFATWRSNGSPEAMAAAFADPNGLFYGPGWLSAVVGGDDALVGMRFGAVLAAGLAAGLTFGFANRVAGLRAGVVATVALWCIPRFWAAVSVASPSIFVLAAGLTLWRVVISTRDDGRWFGPAALAGGAALAMGFPVWLLLLPLAWLVLVTPGTVQNGVVRVRPTSVLVLILPLVCAGVFIALAPWLHDDTFTRMGDLLGLWLERPAEPVLIDGVRWGPIRPWPWTIVTLVAVTTPVAVFLPALAGLGIALRQLWKTASDTWQELVVFAVASIFIPVLLSSAYHGGADILLFAAVVTAILCGVCADAAWKFTRHGHIAVVASAAVLAVLSVADIRSCDRVWESYHAGWIGGTAGAVLEGYSRYPHGPVSLEVLRTATDRGHRRFAILVNAWEVRPVFERYRTLRLLPEDAHIVGVEEADAVIVALDDTLGEFYDVIDDWTRLADRSPERVIAQRADGVVVFAVGDLR